MSTPRLLVITALAATVLPLATPEEIRAQGCVAVRPMGCSSSQHINPSILLLEKGEFQAQGSYLYFRSFRHFRGDHEETHRVEEGTEVVNVVNALDFGLGYGITDRFALTLNVPLLAYDRSSLYEHYGNSIARNPTQARFSTDSWGIGDMRLTGSYWLFDPMFAYNGNVSLGLGVKAPTGNENVQGDFHKMASDGSDSLVTKPVDRSIQLGDGGWGIILSTEGYRGLFANGSLFFNAFYLANPRETNDTQHNATTYHSVADQYAARLGLDYAVLPTRGFSLSMAGRIEGIPSEDLIGGSEGRRRPGYAVSVEPGMSYRHKSWTLSLNAPIAVYRNRTQSVSDKQRTEATGEWVQGDAAFADYLINFTISTQFGKSHAMMEPHEME